MDSIVLNTAEEDVIEWECEEGVGPCKVMVLCILI